MTQRWRGGVTEYMSLHFNRRSTVERWKVLCYMLFYLLLLLCSLSLAFVLQVGCWFCNTFSVFEGTSKNVNWWMFLGGVPAVRRVHQLAHAHRQNLALSSRTREREREVRIKKKSTCERMCVVTINMGQQALNISVCIMNETICISNVLFSIWMTYFICRSPFEFAVSFICVL